MAGLLNCLKSDVIVLRGDAGFHSGLLGEYVPDGTAGGKRRYRFKGGPYQGRDTVYLLWSAVDSAWKVQAPQDTARNLRASVAWISCQPIIRNGPGTAGPQDVPRGCWILADDDKRAPAPALVAVKVRPGVNASDGSDAAAASARAAPRDVDYTKARWLCRYLGWAGAHQFYMGRTYHGFAMLQSGGFLGIGWIVDVFMFDALYVAPPPRPTDEKSAAFKEWVEEYGEMASPPLTFTLPLGLRMEFHGLDDAARVLLQLAFAWVYEWAFRVFLQHAAETYMLVWALKVLGCCIAVWLIGSIGGVRASIAGMAQAVAVVVGVCTILLRFPIWAPQFTLFVRLGIVVVYYFTRRMPRHPGGGGGNTNAVNSSGGGGGFVFQLVAGKDGRVPAGPPPPARVAHDLKRALLLSFLALGGFLLLAAISHANNTIIVCAYREHLSLSALVVIAVKEHGA
jgi:hypothetical protein